MKKSYAFSALFALAAGCATEIINPVTVPLGPHDSEIYEAGKRRTDRKEEKKYSVDVLIDVDAIDLQRVSMTREQVEEHLVSAIDGYLRSRLQKFPFFKVTTADSVVARMRAKKMAAAVETGDEAEVAPREEAQYVILAKFDSVMTHGDGGVANASTVGGTAAGVGGIGSIAGGVHDNGLLSATGIGTGVTLLSAGAAAAGLGNGLEPNVVDVTMSFEFYDNVHEQTVSSENIARKYSGSSKDNTPALILQATRACVDEYLAILGRDYLQESRVLETRGDGRYARVSLGIKDGVKQGTQVYFYEFEDLDDVMAGWSKSERTIAYGTIVGEPTATQSWVEVEQYDKVAVRKYHFVKVMAVQKTKSSIRERMGL